MRIAGPLIAIVAPYLSNVTAAQETEETRTVAAAEVSGKLFATIDQTTTFSDRVVNPAAHFAEKIRELRSTW